jgi:hypothetical protein
MSDLDPFLLNSLQKMRAELIGMQMDELSFQSLNDLLPKYRDGLVGTGVYNAISQMQSGHQYVTDVDQLDAVRRQTIKMVDAAIATLDGQQAFALAAQENIPSLPEKVPAPAKPRATLLNFPRRWWDTFRKQDEIRQSAIVLGVLASLGGATWSAISYRQVWLAPVLEYLNIRGWSTAERNAPPSIFVECNYGVIPRLYPASGRFYFTEIFPSLINEHVSLALGYRFGAPGAATLPPDVVEWAYECTLTNYGNLPVFNVVVPIRVTFQEAHRPPNQQNGWQSGSVKAIKASSITIAKIDVGRENPFLFYLKSQSPDFVGLEFLEIATLQEGSDQTTKAGRLIVAANSHIQFSPNETFQMKSP